MCFTTSQSVNNCDESVPNKSALDDFVPATASKWIKGQDREVARTIDKVSRVAFPLTFCVFNVIYWPIYATHS